MKIKVQTWTNLTFLVKLCFRFQILIDMKLFKEQKVTNLSNCSNFGTLQALILSFLLYGFAILEFCDGKKK